MRKRNGWITDKTMEKKHKRKTNEQIAYGQKEYKKSETGRDTKGRIIVKDIEKTTDKRQTEKKTGG